MDEKEKKTFQRIGARDIRLSIGYRNAKLEKANDCYCPVCGNGPMNGCNGICVESSNNPFEFDDNSPGERMNDLLVKEAQNALPEDGDPCICCYCANILSYQTEDNKLTLKKLSRADTSRIRNNPDVWNGLLKSKEFIENCIEEKRILGDRRYAGNSIKSVK